MQSVLYIGNNTPVAQVLEQYVQVQNLRLEILSLPLQKELTNLTEAKVIILSSPLVIEGMYFAAEGLWKKYLEHHRPEVILLNAGFKGAQHSNYLDLLSLPKDWASFIEQAQTVSANWTPISNDGMDMQEKIRRFFEGHGDESLTDTFNKIFRILKIVGDELKIHQVDYEEVKRELILPNHLPTKWLTLKSRWANYFPYFSCLPFFDEFQKIGEWLASINPYFESGCEQETLLWQLDCLSTIEKIKSNLTSISKHYVC